MNKKQHYILWNVLFPCIVIPYFLFKGFDWFILLAGYLAVFIVDPDIDIVMNQKSHRWFLTHSIILPLVFYLILNQNCIGGRLFVVLGLPVLVHLLGDFFKLKDLIYTKDGTWGISFYPIKWRLDKIGSYIWILCNITIIIISLVLIE